MKHRCAPTCCCKWWFDTGLISWIPLVTSFTFTMAILCFINSFAFFIRTTGILATNFTQRATRRCTICSCCRHFRSSSSCNYLKEDLCRLDRSTWFVLAFECNCYLSQMLFTWFWADFKILHLRDHPLHDAIVFMFFPGNLSEEELNYLC